MSVERVTNNWNRYQNGLALHVLIEGLDYAGKSSTAEALTVALRRQGYSVRLNRGGLYHGLVARHANRLPVSGSIPSYYRNLIYALVPILDRLCYRVPSGEIVIQESYVHRMIAYQKVHGIRIIPSLMERFSPFFRQFDVSFLLTVRYEERLRRFHQRKKRNEVDRVLITRPEVYMKMDVELHRQLCHRPHVYVMDTSDQTLDQVVIQIMSVLTTFLEHAFADSN